MLPEILARNLRVLFVGTTVAETSNELGFYYLGPNNRFWGLLEYAGITPVSVVTPQERRHIARMQRQASANIRAEKHDGQIARRP